MWVWVKINSQSYRNFKIKHFKTLSCLTTEPRLSLQLLISFSVTRKIRQQRSITHKCIYKGRCCGWCKAVKNQRTRYLLQQKNKRTQQAAVGASCPLAPSRQEMCLGASEACEPAPWSCMLRIQHSLLFKQSALRLFIWSASRCKPFEGILHFSAFPLLRPKLYNFKRDMEFLCLCCCCWRFWEHGDSDQRTSCPLTRW